VGQTVNNGQTIPVLPHRLYREEIVSDFLLSLKVQFQAIRAMRSEFTVSHKNNAIFMPWQHPVLIQTANNGEQRSIMSV